MMKFPDKIVFILALFLLSIACRTGIKKDSVSTVHYYGSVESIKKGDFQPVFDMDSIADKQNIYAIGNMEGSSGEIQIFNSIPWHSTVVNDTVIVGSGATPHASFIVYTQVKEWREIPLPLSVVNQESLVGFLEYDEDMSKISAKSPLVFTIEGEAEQISWEVIKGLATDSLTHDGYHHPEVVSGVIQDVEVEILGFYSRDHMGIFTHQSLPLHLHFKTADGMLAGHLDDLELGPDMTMRIPNIK